MARLGDICEIQSGGTPARSNCTYWEGGTIPWVKISDIKGKHLNKTEEYITESGLQNSSAKLFPKGTILYTIFATLGETCILDIDAATNQAIAGLTVKSDIIYREYLYYYLFSLKSVVDNLGRGVAQNNINMSILRNLPVPLPPLDEQRHIAAVLDKVSELIAKRRQQLDKLDELVKSRFIEMFGDPQSNPHGYQYAKLSDIATYFNGLTYKPENVAEEGTIVLRSSNIQNSQLDFADTVRVNCAIKKRLMVKENDILMCSRNGSAKLVGKVALIKGIQEPTSFGAFMMIIRSQYFGYLMTYFQMDAFRQQIKTGATTTINQITGRMLDDVTIPLPPMALVEQFTAFVAQTDKSKSTIQKSLEKLEILKKALLQKYFG